MTPERRKTIEALFNEVAALTPDEQAARLAAIGDSEIAREVQSLLGKTGIETLAAGTVAGVSDRLLDSANIPRQIGPWRIGAKIGMGGMGEVYLAEDVRLGRPVALKLLPNAVAARPAAIERFRQEARTASALNHPNIVTIHEIGEDQGRQYIVTEYVEGQTVRRLLANGALPFRRCLDIATQTAAALGAAHAAGIVHRDIKPENLMVRPDGFVKVLDFGLAKLLTPPEMDLGSHELGLVPSFTNPGMILGTPGYMSPEQARAEVVDARSDLFSLGAVLHEMLTGAAPFARASTIETLAAVIDREPPILSCAPDAPPDIVPVVGRLLAKDPAQRYQSAPELLADLRRLQLKLDSGQWRRDFKPDLPRVSGQQDAHAASAGSVGNLRRVGDPPSGTLPLARARRKRWPLVAAAFCALAFLAILFRWMYPGTSPWFQTTRLTRIPGRGASHTEVLSPDGRYIAYDTLLPDGNQTLSVRLLAADSVIELVPGAPVAYDSLAFSPDGSYLYFVSRSLAAPRNAGILFFIPVLGGTPHKLLENVAGNLAFSPDGSTLAFVRRAPPEAVLWIAGRDGSAPRELLRSRAEFAFRSVDWSADSRDIIFVETSGNPTSPDCRILSINRNGGAPRTLAHPGKLFVYDLAALPDGSGFIANVFDHEVGLPQIFHISRAGAIRHITHDLSQYQGMSLTRDGKQILTSQVSRISELWVVDPGDPASARLITEAGRRFDRPVWARDGTIVSARVEAGKWILWATAPDGETQGPLMQQSALDLEPSACPDRDEIVFASVHGGAYSIWRSLAHGSDLKQLTFGVNDRLPQCVAGGTVLYQSQSDGRRVTMRVPLEGGAAAAVSFPTYDQPVSPDGRLVLAPYVDERTHERRIAVRSRDESAPPVTFPYGGRVAAWSPDSRGFADARGTAGVQEIWYQSLDGGAARQLTRFGKDAIFGLSWSPDGRRLVCARGRFTSDMVLIQDTR